MKGLGKRAKVQKKKKKKKRASRLQNTLRHDANVLHTPRILLCSVATPLLNFARICSCSSAVFLHRDFMILFAAAPLGSSSCTLTTLSRALHRARAAHFLVTLQACNTLFSRLCNLVLALHTEISNVGCFFTFFLSFLLSLLFSLSSSLCICRLRPSSMHPTCPSLPPRSRQRRQAAPPPHGESRVRGLRRAAPTPSARLELQPCNPC